MGCGDEWHGFFGGGFFFVNLVGGVALGLDQINVFFYNGLKNAMRFPHCTILTLSVVN